MTLVEKVQDAIQQLTTEGIRISVRTVHGRTRGSYPAVAEALRTLRADLSEQSPPPQEKAMPDASTEHQALYAAVRALRPLMEEYRQGAQRLEAIEAALQTPPEDADSDADYLRLRRLEDVQPTLQARLDALDETLPALLTHVQEALAPMELLLTQRWEAYHAAVRRKQDAHHALNALPGQLIRDAQQLLQQAAALTAVPE